MEPILRFKEKGGGTIIWYHPLHYSKKVTWLSPETNSSKITLNNKTFNNIYNKNIFLINMK